MRAAGDDPGPVVYSWVSEEYRRERLVDGSLQPEFYALSNGGRVPGTTSDATIDRVAFPEIATLAMQVLAGQGYRYGMTVEQTKLLVVLQWGQTIPYNRSNYQAAMDALSVELPEFGGDSANLNAALMRMRAENEARRFRKWTNAWLLGYTESLDQANGPLRFAGFGDKYYDLLDEVEEPRYYVIISAYDFQEAHRRGNPKLLWVTRVSVFAHRHRFDESFAPMLRSAANYLGRPSRGLVRDANRQPRVDLGEMRSLGPVDSAADGPDQPPPAPAQGSEADRR